MKKLSKILSALLVIILTLTMCSVGMTVYAATDDVVGDYKFNITSTYADIDWNNWKAYKAETHVHTVRSDADTEVDDMIEYYYGFGYDAMALTDHGTVNYGWTSGQSRIVIFDYQFFVHGAIDNLSEERYQEITTGTGAVQGGSSPRGYGMREIPLGIELNGMSTKKCHINGFYADYGHGELGTTVSWPRDAVAGNYKANGLTHINHVGEWSDAKDDIGVYDSKFISDFASIYQDYGIMRKNRDESNLRGCLGMELVNTADSRTRNDRYLYDEILKILAPQGINVLGFCEDDAHELSDCDRNAQYFIMPSNDMATNNIKHSMMYGQFYTCSKNSKNAYELGDGFNATGAYPSVSYVGVDDAKNQIIINSKNANKIRIVADGEIIDTYDINAGGESSVFDLNKYENKINSYVRIYLTGPGGILYLQPFLVEKSVAPVSTVTFEKPSTDTDVNVYDANGTLVSPVNTNSVYVLDAGNYTYVASRPGYLTTDPIPFTVSQSDIDGGIKRTIKVILEQDTSVVSTFFQVPETIYVSGYDSMTFTGYADRQNTPDGELISNISNSRTQFGHIYFSREGASDINISYEVVEGIGLSTLTLSNSEGVLDTKSCNISSGKMSAPIPSGGHSLIKWTASYKINNKTLTSTAYTYVYGPLTGSNSTIAAGGQARTKKNITSWAHTTMHITASVWITGVHSVSGGSGAYKFTPYGGTQLTDTTDADALITSGIGMGIASDESSGGSKEVNVVGGTGKLTIDTSRYNNLNQIPGLAAGLDINNCTEGEDASEAYLNLGSTQLYYSNAAITGSYTAKRLYQSDTVNDGKNLYWPIDTSVPSVVLLGSASCVKSKRTDKVNAAVTLELNYVNKASLRDQYNNAIKKDYQADWFESESQYQAYQNAIKNAAIALGKPNATQDEINSAETAVINAVKSVVLKDCTVTVNYRRGTNDYADTYKSETLTCKMGDTVTVPVEDLVGYNYYNSWICRSGGNALVTSGNQAIASFTATDENLVLDFYYNNKNYHPVFLTTDSAVLNAVATAYYGETYHVPAAVPALEGYTFKGWMCDEDGVIYQPNENFKWQYDTDVSFNPIWEAKTYTASYYLDGGTGLTSLTESVQYMDKFNVTNTIPEKEGYTFAGWSARTKGGEDLGLFTAGSSISWNKADDVYLTAQWVVVPVEITLNPNGGTLSSTKITLNYGDEYGTLPEPVKAGSNFDGWYLDADFKTPVTAETVVTNYSNHTLYAKWSMGQYKITYYVNDEFYAESTYNYGDKVTAAPSPATEGYTFSGWDNVPATMPANNVTVKATLTINSYKIYYYVDGTQYTTRSYNYGEIINPIEAPAKTGYTFAGWQNLPSKMPAHDVTVTADYNISTYSVTYYVDGSIYRTDYYTYNSAVIPAAAPTKTGYTFSGWSDIPSTMPADNINVYGTFSSAKYKLKYYVDGELYHTDEYAYKESITPLAEPTRTGSEFSGWSYIPATMPSRDYTVNGSFTANEYSYYFVVDGSVRSDLTIKGHYGDKVTAPVITAPENYVFSGWSPSVPETIGAETMYFYGTMSKTKSTVSYSLNGGTGSAPYSTSYDIGTVLSLPSIGFTKSGYVFSGWSDSSTAISGTYQYTVNKNDVTLYAVWNAVTVRIEPSEESTTVVDNILNLILGVKERITKSEFQNDYVDIIGENGKLEYKDGIGFGTGSEITLCESNNVVKTYKLVVYGDVDGDGIADGQDVQIATMLKEGILTKAQAGEAVYEAADCNHDGSITDDDIHIIINSGIKLQQVDQTK